MFNLHRAIRYFILIQLMIFPLAVASDSVKTSEFKITDIPEDINALPGTPLNTDTDIQKSLDKTEKLPLTLEQALKLADGQNITIDVAKANQQVAHLSFILGLTQLLPNVTLQYTQSKLRGAIQGFGGQVIHVIKNTYQPQATVNYTIYTGGSNIFALIANKRLADAQKSLTENARQDILRQVAISYFTLQQNYWSRAIAEQAIKETEEQLAVNEARYKNGIGLKLDMLQTQTLLSSRKQLLLQAENNISLTSNHLAHLLNLDFNVLVIPTNIDITKTELVAADTPAKKLLTIAEQNNFQLKSLEQTVLAGKATYRSALTSIFPQVTLTGYAAETGPAISQTQYAQFQGLQATTNILTGLGFGAPTVIRQAKTNEKLSELQLAEANKLMEEDLANSITTIQALNNNINVTAKTLSYAQDAYKQAYGRLHEGVGINLDLQTAITSLTQARIDYVSALSTYNQAEVNLLTNLGKASINNILNGFNTTPQTTSTSTAKTP